MEIGPILRAMWRNKTGACLIALQIALTLAVVVNSLFIINGRIEKMQRPVGVDAENIFSMRTVPLANDLNVENFIRNDLREIRALPGVLEVTPILTYLQSGSSRMSSYRAMPEKNDDMEVLANINFVDERGLEALGARLIAGRFFRADEIQYITEGFRGMPDKVVVSESMGRKFFPEGDMVGKTIYYSTSAQAITIIGVISDVAAAWMAVELPFFENTYYNFMLQPYIEYDGAARYLIRAEEGQLDSVIPEVEKTLLQAEPNRLISAVYTQAEVLERSYSSDRATLLILVTVMSLMIVITGLGIVGLASFSVSQRTRQIGTRRALGARKRDVLRYFFLENVLLTSIGVVIGGALTYLLSYLLLTQFGGERLDPLYYPVGVVMLYVLGLVAVYGPAQRAASIPPAIATRTV
ncbi:MAG: putative ABC transport system permease protein [Halieaceae bacterium]|jgi:putative ABC transport system permease protein